MIYFFGKELNVMINGWSRKKYHFHPKSSQLWNPLQQNKGFCLPNMQLKY